MAIPLWLAILIGLLSSLVQSLGLTIQRKSHLLTAALPLASQRPSHKRPLWLLGFAIFISSNVLGTLFQVGALPIVVLAPLGAVSLVANSLFAKVMLGDVFTRSMGVGTVLITTGAVLIATFGVVDEPLLELDELLRLFARREWWLFSSLVGAGVSVALVVCHTIEYLLNRRSPVHGPIYLPAEADEEDGAPRTPLTKLPAPPAAAAPAPAPTTTTTSRERDARTRLYLALAYSFISGTLSGLCLLFAKTGVELLLSTLSSRKSQFSVGTVVFGGGGLLVLALAQLYYLNHALRLQSPTLVCPVAFSAYNVSSVFGGLVYFDQLAQLSGLKFGLVGVGVGVLLLGVGAVSIGGCSGGDKGCEGGGVGVGVWVEEEEDCQAAADDDEADGYFNESYTDEPVAVTPSSPTPAHWPPVNGRQHRPSLPAILTSPSSTGSYHPPRRSSTTHSHARYLPFSPTLPPQSPTAGGHSGQPTQHDHPTSTGLFSIGLGAASPGFFVVGRPAGGHGGGRSASVDAGGGRRRSEARGKSGLGFGTLAAEEDEEAAAGGGGAEGGSSSALAD